MRDINMNSILTIDRAIDVLQTFTLEKISLTLEEICDKTRIPKNTVTRILYTLEQRGFLQYDQESALYKPGLGLFEFILLQSAVLDVQKEAEEYLIELHNKTKQTVMMALKENNDQIFYVFKKENDEGLKVSSLVGLHRPYLSGVLGPVVLAFLPDREIERILKMPIPQSTPYTVTDPAAIRERLHKIKRDGYFIASNETAIGVTGIGAPIFDMNGEAIAAIGVVGPAIQLDSRIEDAKQLLLDTSAKISARIGYRKPGK